MIKKDSKFRVHGMFCQQGHRPSVTFAISYPFFSVQCTIDCSHFFWKRSLCSSDKIYDHVLIPVFTSFQEACAGCGNRGRNINVTATTGQ